MYASQMRASNNESKTVLSKIPPSMITSDKTYLMKMVISQQGIHCNPTEGKSDGQLPSNTQN